MGNFLRAGSNSIFVKISLKSICISFLCELSVHILYPFFYRVIDSFLFDFISSLYIREIRPLFQIGVANIPFKGCFL